MIHIMRRTPFAPAFQLRRDIDDLFGRFFGQMSGGETAQSGADWPTWTPAVEGRDEEGQWVIRVALPGVDPKDVEIAMAQNQLTIKGQRKTTGESKNDNYFARELTYGWFERSFTLPEGVDPAKVNARYTNGILEVRVPKPVAEAPRKVAIEVDRGDERPVKAA